jgi:hypothetical protein
MHGTCSKMPGMYATGSWPTSVACFALLCLLQCLEMLCLLRFARDALLMTVHDLKSSASCGTSDAVQPDRPSKQCVEDDWNMQLLFSRKIAVPKAHA